MKLFSCILTENDCYRRGARITPKGIMVHSTGANNPWLRRYVQPDDGRLGKNTNSNDWNRPGLDVCVHAFIGKTADGTVAVYQTLPWNRRGWHAGSGRNGSANDGYLSFEICEDGLTERVYFDKVFRAAAELTAYLCASFGLDPKKDGVILDHSEGYRRGIASNHGDVSHWLKKFGKTMDDFRRDVIRLGEVENMTREELEALVDERVKKALVGADSTASDWAREELQRAKEHGITDGTRPRGYATREEAAIMVERLHAALTK